LNADFEPGVESIRLGDWAADRLTPCRKVGAGFLRIKVDVLRRMRDELPLPLCDMANGSGWPFFQPTIVEQDGRTRYLTEDYAFCHRCGLIGSAPLIDTSIRLYHIGDYAYGWEESAGEYIPRSRHLDYHIKSAQPRKD